jgi:hypothetical protein
MCEKRQNISQTVEQASVNSALRVQCELLDVSAVVEKSDKHIKPVKRPDLDYQFIQLQSAIAY